MTPTAKGYRSAVSPYHLAAEVKGPISVLAKRTGALFIFQAIRKKALTAQRAESHVGIAGIKPLANA